MAEKNYRVDEDMQKFLKAMFISMNSHSAGIMPFTPYEFTFKDRDCEFNKVFSDFILQMMNTAAHQALLQFLSNYSSVTKEEVHTAFRHMENYAWDRNDMVDKAILDAEVLSVVEPKKNISAVLIEPDGYKIKTVELNYREDGVGPKVEIFDGRNEYHATSYNTRKYLSPEFQAIHEKINIVCHEDGVRLNHPVNHTASFITGIQLNGPVILYLSEMNIETEEESYPPLSVLTIDKIWEELNY